MIKIVHLVQPRFILEPNFKKKEKRKKEGCITIPTLHRKVEKCYKNLMEKIEIICTQCIVILFMRQTPDWYIAVIYFNHVKMEDTIN